MGMGMGMGRAMMAYGTDGGEVVVMGVEYGRGEGAEEARWRVGEAARFKARGPHKTRHAWDPDATPGTTSLSLGWSAWLDIDGGKTATLAYTAHNYLGLRKVVVQEWRPGEDAKVRVARADTAGLCVTLGADAFVEWEDGIWPAGHGYTARGVVATPAVAKPFQVALVGGSSKPMAPHYTAECGTTYAPAGDTCTNPITGASRFSSFLLVPPGRQLTSPPAIVMHPPDAASSKPPSPQYSLIRLSATPSNTNWFQTTRPSSPLPQWASHIDSQLGRRLPRLDALQGLASDSDSESDACSAQRVPSNYYRCWDMAASPGGTCTAVLVSRHGTLHASRRASCQVLFSWIDDAPVPQHVGPGMTTEGRLWEAVYGGLGTVESVVARGTQSPVLRAVFEPVVQQQRCSLCQGRLAAKEAESVCKAGHAFDTCSQTGLAIMAPNISHLCAVCGLRCLRSSYLRGLARHHLDADATVVLAAGHVCGACGGKFVS
ncbi:hypothetical protein CDD82_5673 [Ophiocordyceps australis]|uniref:Uncharacterized protein n=1 Tax=Ophiocordyceps australis TaxID=1399860 RepID=A0A2C5YWC3_9HYPO|nr:hypothetical protein CDD82_5673 [Ophiocordyceps australis]